VSTIVKRSLKFSGHLTSVSLEQEFWDALKVIAKKSNRSMPDLVAEIDRDRIGGLSSALRVHVLQSIQAEAESVDKKSAEPTEVS
jgi:predicted DNA-binding ribbon-helix-helix protein